ncbi:Cyp51A [Aureobasidium pullulans]|nr:Cyp51A [Aureobasidium pullulans]
MVDLLGIALRAIAFILFFVLLNVVRQLLFANKNEPPVVFHWFPFLGSTITYGMAPTDFFADCQKRYGDIFTFILLGRKTTVYLGLDGNEFILNGKLKDVNAEEVYGPLTTPVFGPDVVYDCPNWKLMEQKKFVKFGLTQHALESHTELIEQEVLDYIKTSPRLKGQSGTIDIAAAMGEITIFTAGRALQGAEVRKKLTTEFAELYHDLDKGFSPINFMLPWAPLPHNKKRDAARNRMRDIYLDIIKERRSKGTSQESDMIANLMGCAYKDGTPVPDEEIAHMMIYLLMAGQHTSSASSSWIFFRLASEPDFAQQLYQEQLQNLSPNNKDLPPLQYSDMAKLPLLQNTIKETLRLHGSLHSIMRKAMAPLLVLGTDFIIPASHTLLASPAMTSLSPAFFPNPQIWNPHRWSTSSDLPETTEEIAEDDKADYGYGVVSKGTKSPYLPFGAGRHRCIGEKYAYLQLQVIVSVLLREFRFENVEGVEGVPETDYSSLFARPKLGSFVRWERRR